MNNNPNTNLNDFLNKNKQSLEDDFEKDAFAGFESISTKNEAFDIKAALDKKINTQLFSEKKRYFNAFSSHNKTVWYAAASLMLIVGLSVLFIKNNGNSIIQNKDISLIDTKQNEANAQQNINDIIQQSSAAQKTKPEEKSVTLGEVEKDKTASNKNRVKNNKNFAVNEKPNSTNDDIAKSNGAAGKTTGYTYTTSVAENNDEANTKAPATKGTIYADDAETKKGEAIASETNRNNTSNTTSNAYPTAKIKEEENDAYKGSVTEKKDSKKKVSKRIVAKKQRAEQNQQPSASATKVANGPTFGDKNLDQEKSESDLESKDNVTLSGAEGQPKTVSATSGANQCYYSGGKTILQKDVAQKLIAKNVNKQFTAILFINEKKQVQKVNFIKYENNITKDDKKIIENELKTLTKFDFYIPPTTKTLFEFKLQYIP